MKVIIFIGLLVSLTSFAVFGQDLACENFKDGYFKIPKDDVAEASYMVRKGNKQTEFMIGKGEKPSKFHVTWTGKCSYTLTPTRKTLATLEGMPKDVMLMVEIIATNENSYTYRATLNFADFEVVTKAVRIDAAEYKKHLKQIK